MKPKLTRDCLWLCLPYGMRPLLLAAMNSSLVTVWRLYNLKTCNRTRMAGQIPEGAGSCACGPGGKTKNPKTKTIACA